MTKEDKYLLGCLYAINRLREKGSSDYGIKVDGKWEIIPWTEICDWIKKEYAIEVEELRGR